MEMSLESGNDYPSILVVIASCYELVCTLHRQTNLQSMPLYSNRGELSLMAIKHASAERNELEVLSSIILALL